MKILHTLLFALLFILIYVPVSAQDVSEGNRNFIKKESANALSIVVQGQPKNVEEVLDKKFHVATGEKTRSYKGLKMVEAARYARISPNTMDMYFRVEKASRTDKENSRVTLFLSEGNNNFISSETHPEAIRAASDILDGLQKEVTIYELELAIEAQTKVIEKAIKDHEKMVDDSVKLENKLAETIQEIETNKIDRKNQLETIDQEKERLTEFQDQLNIVINGAPANNNSNHQLEGFQDVGDQPKNNTEGGDDGGQ